MTFIKSQTQFYKLYADTMLGNLNATSYSLTREAFCYILKAVCPVDTVQDFLIKLGIKPRLHTYIENKHFFTKSCHRQTYQNYEQPPQSLQYLYFQSHFSASKIKGIFLIIFL